MLKAVVVQRLVPVLCSKCSLASRHEFIEGIREINNVGCFSCSFLGTSGRTLIAEVIAYEQVIDSAGVVTESAKPVAVTGTLAEQAYERLLAGDIAFDHALEYIPGFLSYYRSKLSHDSVHI